MDANRAGKWSVRVESAALMSVSHHSLITEAVLCSVIFVFLPYCHANPVQAR